MKQHLPFSVTYVATLLLFISFHARADVIPANDTSLPAKNHKPLSFTSIRSPRAKSANFSYASLLARTDSLKSLAANSQINNDYGIFVDLGLASGKKRFFIVDLTSITIVGYGIVAADNFVQHADTGMYTIDNQQSPTTYALKSMDKTKNNATRKPLLLQSSEDIPEDDVMFSLLPATKNLSISPSTFSLIRKTVSQTQKPILVWIYYGQTASLSIR